MLIIKNEQLDLIEAGVIDNLAYSFFNQLIKEGYDVADKAMVAFIIDNAGEAGIEENKQIYEYAEMAVKNPELLNEDKPGWAKNILYAHSSPEAKLNALRSFISKQNKTIGTI